MALGVKRVIGFSSQDMQDLIRIDGGELRIINDDEILAVVDDPRDILPANIM